MEASYCDLHKKSAEIIKALSRKERVTLLYCGEPAAIVVPVGESSDVALRKASEHAAFGMWADQETGSTVDRHVRKLRRRHFDDL